MPLLMVTMDAEMGVKLVQLVNPEVVVPVHYEYVFESPLFSPSLFFFLLLVWFFLLLVGGGLEDRENFC